MTNFETIYAALFAKLQAVSGIKTASRRLKHWNDVAANLQPALYMVQTGEAPEQVRGLPAKWRLSVEVYVYVNVPTEKIVPSTLLNPILGAIRDILAPDNLAANVNTLGGLVSHCWLSGQIEVYDGVLGDQAVALVPVEILTA